jgi:hypothetical protein
VALLRGHPVDGACRWGRRIRVVDTTVADVIFVQTKDHIDLGADCGRAEIYTERKGALPMPSQPTDFGSYLDERRRRREIVCRAGATGSRLVIDRLAGAGADERLVAHLAADEPAKNARIVCEAYLADARKACRRVQSEDFDRAPVHEIAPPDESSEVSVAGQLMDGSGCAYRLEPDWTENAVQEMRWRRLTPCANGRGEAVSVRSVIGALERYEPVLSLTRQAISNVASDPTLSCSVLCAQLRCIEKGRVVLNRRLREAVHDAVDQRELTLSEIAISCGRLRRRSQDCSRPDTTWVRRRIGDACDTTTGRPTAWVSSDVLALIAREGLGVDPREVEVD